jgi:hypothetical protein
MTEVYITSQMHNTNSSIPTVSEANQEEHDAYTKFMTSGEERKTFVYKDYNFTLERIWSNSKYRNIRLITKSNEFLISDNKQELLSTLSYMTKMRNKKLNVTYN